LHYGSNITREKMGEEEERVRRKNGHNGVALKIDVKMSRRGFLLRKERNRDPPCMHYKFHSKRRKLTQGGGAHHEKRGTPTRRGNSKNGGTNPLS
jgi:hypothetical protein